MSNNLPKQPQFIHIIAGTAGHVDHGKTSIIRHLTNCETDQLKEEKERGLSINLGFAPCPLDNNKIIGVIDVPGHLDFIKNMVAGAGYIDVLILVIAADDGIMPQTKEHIQIIKLLHTPKIIVALTKIDLVDNELQELVSEDINDFLNEHGFKNTPIIPICNNTAQGINQLRTTLTKCVESMPEPTSTGLFRMNIARVFSIKGYGTVVTGIPLSGQIKVGDQIELLPSQKKCKVRSIQNHNYKTNITSTNICSAINITDVEASEIKRGLSIATPNQFQSTNSALVTITNKSNNFTIKHNREISFHSGTAKRKATIKLINKNHLQNGESTTAKILFDEPILLVVGDKFIIRNFTPSLTIGGGQILCTEQYKLKRTSPILQQRLAISAQWLKKNDPCNALLSACKDTILNEEKLQKLTATNKQQLKPILQTNIDAGRIIQLKENLYLYKPRITELITKFQKELNIYHNNHSCSWGMTPSLLCEQIGIKGDAASAIMKLLKETNSFQFNHKKIANKNFKPAISKKQMQQKSEILDYIQKAAFACPAQGTLREIFSLTNQELKQFITILQEEREAIAFSKRVIDYQLFINCRNTILQLITQNDSLNLAEFRETFNITRNIAVDLLDKFDSLTITQRMEKQRILGIAGRALVAKQNNQQIINSSKTNST